MTLSTSRRRLLSLAAALPASLPVFSVAAGNDRTLAFHRVTNPPAGSGVAAGTLVLVDPAIGRFAGEGLYLFPDWGSPVVYAVRAREAMLTFFYPGLDTPLWQLSATHADARFSGRVEGIIDPGTDQDILLALQDRESVQVLEVPERPLA